MHIILSILTFFITWAAGESLISVVPTLINNPYYNRCISINTNHELRQAL
jgi:hypothetical protein